MDIKNLETTYDDFIEGIKSADAYLNGKHLKEIVLKQDIKLVDVDYNVLYNTIVSKCLLGESKRMGSIFIGSHVTGVYKRLDKYHFNLEITFFDEVDLYVYIYTEKLKDKSFYVYSYIGSEDIGDF